MVRLKMYINNKNVKDETNPEKVTLNYELILMKMM